MDPNLVIGCWIITVRFGLAVLTEISEDDCYAIGGKVIERFPSVRFRYPATRCSDGETIWVANGCRLSEVTYHLPPDKETAIVLTLKGPYGVGPLAVDEDD